MAQRILIRRGEYHDSAFLMRVARELTERSGLTEAVVLMGTPSNRELLVAAGFTSAELTSATPLDMVVGLRAESPAALSAADLELGRLLEGGDGSPTSAQKAVRDRSLPEAALAHPEAKLVSVSVPGAYAAYVTQRALDHGRHVFLFSNNVSLQDELALKKRALELGLLVMGPDCGTAIIAGVGLGFANRVPRGPLGIVGPSGTGIQELSSILANRGAGISHAIGTGGRDLTAEVDGMMSRFGLQLLAEDASTKVILLIAKHPAEAVVRRMHDVLRSLKKPTVVRYLGKPAPESRDGVLYATDIDDAAGKALALLAGNEPKPSTLARDMRGRARELLAGRPRPHGRLIGLFGGGSLASEASLILAGHGLATREPDHPLPLAGPIEGKEHLIVDTGEEFYTLGKPHPMVDQTVRCGLLTKAAADPEVEIILFDLVLGDGSHHDPAPELAAAVQKGRIQRGSKPLFVIASITGTDLDPQNASRQRTLLADAGIQVASSAAAAAHLAAALHAGSSDGDAP